MYRTSHLWPTARILLTGAATLALTGCIYRREVVYERPAPPPGEVIVAEPPPTPPRVTEVVTVCPGPGYFWIDGCYEWMGARWVWVGGRWERPMHPGAVWVRSGWHHERGGRVWVSGHWH